MNALFNSALRQSNSIRKDLDAFAEAPALSAALTGQISASLTSLSRTIDDYANLAKQEMIAEKKEKAQERVKTFRGDLTDFREQFNRLKQERDEIQQTTSRNELLGRRPHHAATPENPYSDSAMNAQAQQHNRFGSNPTSAPAAYTREQHTMRESSFLSSNNAILDEYLERGRAVLGDLGHQKEMLKGTQKRLYDVGATLGISGDTIRMVERRARQDKWIFGAGVIVFFLFCWLVLHYLR